MDSSDKKAIPQNLTPAEKRALLAELLRERASREEQVFPLSYNQRGMWFLQQLAPDNSAYNLAVTFRIVSAVNQAALANALQKLVDRHAALRTRYVSRSGEPFQIVTGNRRVNFRLIDASSWSDVELSQQVDLAVRTPFNLARDDVMRAFLYTSRTDDHIFQIVIHHIATDGWSLWLMLNELRLLYEAENGGPAATLPQPDYSYRDFVDWQARLINSAGGQAMGAFWEAELAGHGNLDMPTDFVRPALQSFVGDSQQFELTPPLVNGLRLLAREHQTTLFTVLAATYQILLHRYTGQDDILVSTPTLGRNRDEFNYVVGDFVNSVVLRANLAGNPTFSEFLAQARQRVNKALGNQDYPFPLTVEALAPERDLSRNPIVQAAINLMQTPVYVRELVEAASRSDSAVNFGGLLVEGLNLEAAQQEGQFDLSLELLDTSLSLKGNLKFRTDLFETSTISQLIQHWIHLLKEIVAQPTCRIGQLALDPGQDVNSNIGPTRSLDDFVSVVDLFRRQVERQPGSIAITDAVGQLTYAELEVASSQVAHSLQQQGVAEGELVGLHLRRSKEMVVVILGLWKLGAGYLPLDPAFPMERLQLILADAAAPFVISDGHPDSLELDPATHTFIGFNDLLAGTRGQSEPALASRCRPDSLAYVIYTSGSTGRPKGVHLNQRNVLNFLLAMCDAPALRPDDTLLAITTISFDISVLELFLPLTVGARLVIASDADTHDGHHLAHLLETHQITVMQATPSTWEMLFAADWQGSPYLNKILSGGEALSRQLANKLLSLNIELWNMYGPTETTIWSSVHQVQAGKAPIPLGKPIANTQLYIVDEFGALTPKGVPGELYIGGHGVAQGYWRRPDLSDQRFVPNPFDDLSERLYRTGDVVRLQLDGTLQFLGRTDHQVKIRGHRIELGEIEHALERHDRVKQAVVVCHGEGINQQLVGYIQGRAELNVDMLLANLRHELPTYMIPALLVQVDHYPQTPNRKVDRRSLAYRPISFQTNDTEEPQTQTEQLIADIWSAVLRLNSVGRNQRFFELGGHSLLATQVISRIQQATNVELPLADLFNTPTVAGLAALVDSGRRHDSGPTLPPLAPLPRDTNYPLSFAQERMWFLHQFAPDNAAYHIPSSFLLNGPIDYDLLVQTVQQMVERHEGLRTLFQVEAEVARQVIQPPFEIPRHLVDISHLQGEQQETRLIEILSEQLHLPFDLANYPGWRMALIKLAPEKHVVIAIMHHIMFDQWSQGLFWTELVTLYDANKAGLPDPLPSIELQYPDFAAWQRGWLHGDILEQMMAYWREQLESLPTLAFPTDFVRPPVQSFAGQLIIKDIPRDLTRRIQDLSQRHRTTQYMVAVAIFNLLLQKYCDQEDIPIGIPVANRHRLEVESIIGTFVNSLVLRTDLSGNPSFINLLQRVREVTLDAYANQELPFEKLVDELISTRDFSRTPFFQVIFNLINAPFVPESPAGTEFSLLPFNRNVSQFDFSFTLILNDYEEFQPQIQLEYCTALFEQETMERLIGHYLHLLEQVTADPTKPISEYTLLSQDEKRLLIDDWNDTGTPYPDQSCIHDLFTAQASRTPEQIAVVVGNRSLTYAELEQRSNQLARFLQQKGVGPDDFVGLYMRRNLDMVVGLLGILKSGAAYLPLDPNFPADRLTYMLADSKTCLVLSEERLIEFAPTFAGELICLDRDWDRIAREPAGPIASSVTAKDLAYIIYTSGSTGKPKGVMLEHQSVVNFLTAMGERPGLTAADTLLAVTTLSFDISVLEIFLPLTTGARLVMVSKEVAADGWLLAEAMDRHQITIMQATPVTWSMLIESDWGGTPTLQKVLCGGEALSRELANQILERDVELWNMYGPTETTIWSAVEQIEPGDTPITIGHPIANTTFYILDRQQRPVPIGVPGELLIGGDGLARGYLNRPELTADRFIPDPSSTRAGARLYRTGDLARFKADGNVEFMGRLDFQVKVRGYRIELGEIEHVLDRHPAIRESVVIAREDNPGDKRLVAYYLLQTGHDEPTPAEWRTFMQAHLPDYMIPSHFVPLDKFPLTPNRKVNRQGFPAPAVSRLAERPFIPPANDLEFILADTLANILSLEKVSVEDNFFELGGHSLQATRYLARVNKNFRTDLPLRAFLQKPTVQDFAKYMVSIPEQKRRIERSATLMRRVAKMSPEEVKAMLAQRKASA